MLSSSRSEKNARVDEVGTRRRDVRGAQPRTRVPLVRAPRTDARAGPGRTALVDTLVPRERLDGPENKYPLAIGFCPSCALLQTLDTVPPQEVFHEDYTYYASFSETWLEHCRRNALKQIERFKLDGDSLVVELASNDGYLLRNFVEQGHPACWASIPAPGPVAAARKIGVPTLCDVLRRATSPTSSPPRTSRPTSSSPTT